MNINPSPKKVTGCASKAKPNRRGAALGLTEEDHCQKARATRKIDFEKPQPAGCHLFRARVNILRPATKCEFFSTSFEPWQRRSRSLAVKEIASRSTQSPGLKILSPKFTLCGRAEYNFGGTYLPEILFAPIAALQAAWERFGSDSDFFEEYLQILKEYAGRETPLTEVKRFAKAIDGPRIFLKREDLLHTGAHKLNNALGQCLLAKKMGKKRIIAETGAGQHGVATATACAYLDLQCVVYMGKVDVMRQAPNVAKMRLLGAEVISVEKGTMTLKDAVNEALRDWSFNYEESHYCLGSALGPHPYPEMVAAFQSVIGTEASSQINAKIGRDPDLIVACVGGGSNAIGIFSAFLDNPLVALIGVEAGGKGEKLGEHAARFNGGKPGVLHGCFTYLLQDAQGQVAATHSISAGLDYPAIGPQHSILYESGRARYASASDEEAIAAFKLLSQTEGIIPALESSHALAYVMKIASQLTKNTVILVNLSGRGDKDLPQLIEKGLI